MPEFLKGYKLKEPIRETSNSRTFRAYHDATESNVIIKVPVGSYIDKRSDQSFRSEYEIAKGLEHPGVAHYKALEHDDNGLGIIVEDIGGIALGEHIKKSSYSTKDALDIAIKIADALEYIHQKGVVHKDINPNNIVIDPNSGRVQLIDFSLASLLNIQRQDVVAPGMLHGTMPYISPEQTGRMNRVIDYRTDLYSFGVTLYQLFTKRLPFDYKDPLETIHAHIARVPEPPSRLVPEVSQIVSDIILKLMAKNAEDRYQTAYGAKSDLEFCLENWNQLESASLELGEHDQSARFAIPEKLYGREELIEKLISSFNHVQSGSTELLSIGGYSGTGKTALVLEVQKPISATRGYFIAGKSDQLQRAIPYQSWLQAFSSLIDQILTADTSTLEILKQEILDALGENGRVLTDVLPNLEFLIGKQPEVDQLNPAQAQNRFNYLIDRFISAIAHKGRPLVVFLDDMQWADAASLKLLESILKDGRNPYLLVITTYRDNEVSKGHPFMVVLDVLRETNITLTSLTVDNLGVAEITQLIAETFGTTKTRSEELAHLVHEKTYGNAFFATEFLKTLHLKGLVVFDFKSRTWTWDVDRIRSQNLTNNVVEMMTARFADLPDETLNILKQASCIGSSFDMHTLEVISGKHAEGIYDALLPALEQGYLEQGAGHYTFVHDRIQQAVYETIPEGSRAIQHMGIGRLILANTPEEEIDGKIFTIVNHWNIGATELSEDDELRTLFELNLRAGKQAFAANAYQAANTFLLTGAELLEKHGWEIDRDKRFQLRGDLAEIAYMLGNFERAETIINEELKLSDKLNVQVRLHRLLALLYTMDSRYVDAIGTARTALDLLEIDFPGEGDELAPLIGQEIGGAFERVGERAIASLVDLDLMTEERPRLTSDILSVMLAPAFFTDPELFALVVSKLVNLSLDNGNVPWSCFGYGCFGLILSASAGQYEAGYEYGKLSLELSKKLGSTSEQGRAFFHLAEFTSFWRRPLEETRKYNTDGYLLALESGDVQYAGYLSIWKAVIPCLQDRRIQSGRSELVESFHFNSTTQNILGAQTALAARLAFANLTGSTSGTGNFDIEETTEADFVANCLANLNVLAAGVFYSFKMMAQVHHGLYNEALETITECDKYIGYLAGMYFTSEYNFHTTVCLLELQRAGVELEDSLAERISANMEQYDIWNQNCPENFGHKHMITVGLKAEVEGKPLEAIAAFNKAVTSAADQGFNCVVGMAQERLGRIWSDMDQSTYASLHYRRGTAAYYRWGAEHKVKQLSAMAPGIDPMAYDSGEFQKPEHTTDISTSSGTKTEEFDFKSIVKASQALSSEIVLSRLLEKMMGILVESAGARKGFYILAREGKMVIEAEKRIEDSTNVHLNKPINKTDLAVTVVNFVYRSKQEVVINDAANDERFREDEYIISEKPKSIVCIPIEVGRGREAVLYMENSLVTGAFTEDRLQIFKVLSSQIAISLENAYVYATLEDKVRERTREVVEQKEQLEETLSQLKETQMQLISSEKMASLGQLTAGIAHEINNPINFVSANIDTLKLDFDDLLEIITAYQHVEQASDKETALVEAKELRESLDMNILTEEIESLIDGIREGSRRTNEIVRGLRDFSRLDENDFKPADLNQGIESTLALLNNRIEPGVSIIRNFSDLPQVECLPGQINQVIMNIITNALQAVNGQGNIEIATFIEEDEAIIQIGDDGAGMPEDVKNRIFEPFFTTKDVGEGTGLGLSISYGIIDKHQGTINFKSEEGKGTQFEIRIPILRKN